VRSPNPFEISTSLSCGNTYVKKREIEKKEEEEERKMSTDREASSNKGCKEYIELDVWNEIMEESSILFWGFLEGIMQDS